MVGRHGRIHTSSSRDNGMRIWIVGQVRRCHRRLLERRRELRRRRYVGRKVVLPIHRSRIVGLHNHLLLPHQDLGLTLHLLLHHHGPSLEVADLLLGLEYGLLLLWR